MKKTALAILFLLLSSVIYAQSTAPQKEFLSQFSAIDVDAPIRLKLIKIAEHEAPYIVFDTKGATMSKFHFEVNDKTRTLKITERHDSQRKTITEVEVYFTKLTDISISKADTTIEGTLTSQLLDIYTLVNAHL